jgi:hypothetical protein
MQRHSVIERVRETHERARFVKRSSKNEVGSELPPRFLPIADSLNSNLRCRNDPRIGWISEPRQVGSYGLRQSVRIEPAFGWAPNGAERQYDQDRLHWQVRR